MTEDDLGAEASITSPAARWLPWVPLIASLYVTSDLLGNFFLHDDYIHLFSVSNGPLWSALLEGHAGHWLFSYNLLFWLFHLLFGLNAALYFFALLLAHALNVWLLFGLIRRATDRLWLAAFGASLWGMCPYNEGTLGWISVLGQVFATTAVLWVTKELLDLERSGGRPSRLQLLRLYGLLLVAASSFGIGLGVVMGFGVAVFVWNPVPGERMRLGAVFASLAVMIPALYFGTSQFEVGGGQAGWIEDGGSYIEHWYMIPGGVLYLLSLGVSGLLLGPALAGDVAVVGPGRAIVMLSYAVAGLIAGGLVFCLASSSDRVRRRLLAWLMLTCCAYGIIALGRWFTFSDAEPVYRYHYLATALASLVLCQMVSALVGHGSRSERWGRWGFAVWLIVMLIPYDMAIRQDDSPARLQQRIQHHKNVAQINEQLSLRPGATGILLENFGFIVQPWQNETPLTFPGRAAFFILMYPSNTVNGARVRFIERDPEVLRLAREQAGSRISELLVAPPEELGSAR